MNPTIVKIIDLMFRGIAETEETAAIREELLTNSQARYEDLIASGMSPDDALGQVLDNLRGMESVLDEYRSGKTSRSASQSSDDGFAFARFERMAEEIDRKMERFGDKVEDTAENAFSSMRSALDSAMESVRNAMGGLGDSFRSEPVDNMAYTNPLWQEITRWGADDESTLTAVFQPGQVNHVSFHLIGEDVEVEPSDDGCVHVEINKADEPMFQLGLQDGCLTLNRVRGRQNVDAQELENEELEGLGGIFAGIGRALRGVFRMERTSGDPVRLLLPDGISLVTLQTTSGDIDLTGLTLGGLTAATTSGDIDVEDTTVTGATHLTSTSGDVDVSGTFGESLSLNATSGDIDFSGNALHLSANNVSGDTDLQGRIAQVKANSVSGDIDIRSEMALEGVQANTTSGDIEVVVPEGVVPCVKTNTTCGSVTVDCPTVPASALTIRLNSVSGDLTVTNF